MDGGIKRTISTGSRLHRMGPLNHVAFQPEKGQKGEGTYREQGGELAPQAQMGVPGVTENWSREDAEEWVTLQGTGPQMPIPKDNSRHR